MEDSKVFIKKIEEMFDRFKNENYLMFSDFLSLEEQSMVSGFLRANKKEGVHLFGGYSEAERKMVLYIPEYILDEIKEIEIEGEPSNEITDFKLQSYFFSHCDDSNLKLLSCTIPPNEKAELSHRDYLGALMGEGIKREKIGDILVNKNGAKIIVMDEMAEYLLKEYGHVGRATLTTKLEPISNISLGEIRTETLSLNVASPRLDNVVSEVFHLSRKLSQEAISKGIVFLDGIQMSKPDHQLKGGEKLVLRGKGKAIYKGITGKSKKGNSYIEVIKYI